LQSDANSQAGDLPALDIAELDIRGSGRDHEKLDHRYHRRPDASEFFVPGRVFAILWHERAGDKTGGHLSQAEPFNVQMNGKKKGKYNEEIFGRIRRMVVVNARNGYCLCLPSIPTTTKVYQRRASVPSTDKRIQSSTSAVQNLLSIQQVLPALISLGE
jgi:hypothetical protein